jgi:Hemerythrin HHE cation binding domain
MEKGRRPMNQRAIRGELLEEHARLRGMIGEVREAAANAPRVEATRQELRSRIQRLHTALRAHNCREEEILKDFLANVDAWGAVRVEIMGEEHIAEHVELCAMLLDVKLTSDSAILDGTLDAALDHVLNHMSREEIACLGEDVLRDDGVVEEQMSG